MSSSFSPLLRTLRSRKFQVASASVPSLYLCASFMSTAKSVPAGSVANSTWPATSYKPSYDKFPYTKADFQRHDLYPDQEFYQQARILTHIGASHRGYLHNSLVLQLTYPSLHR